MEFKQTVSPLFLVVSKQVLDTKRSKRIEEEILAKPPELSITRTWGDARCKQVNRLRRLQQDCG